MAADVHDDVAIPLSQARKYDAAESKRAAEYTGDYTYGRLYDEERIFLNKSGTKYISMGIHPGTERFQREIRLHSAGMKPFSLLLKKYELAQLFNAIKETPGFRKTAFTYPVDTAVSDDGSGADGERYKIPIKLEKTQIGNDIFKIIHPNGQFMFMGAVSLQSLLDFEPLIYTAYEELNADYLKTLYDKFVHELLQVNYEFAKFEDIVRDSLLQTAITSWNDRSFYTQTYMHFTDFAVAHVTFLKNKQNK